MLWRVKPRAPTRFVIAKRALDKIISYRQVDSQPEAGGILLGQYFPKKNLVRICFATRPGGKDKRARCSFERDAARSTRLAGIMWGKSGGEILYLGEWHTHPEADPIPSWVDRNSMMKQLRESSVVTPGLVLIIAGKRENWTGFWTLEGHRRIQINIEPDQNGLVQPK